jgi:hypothetical protein
MKTIVRWLNAPTKLPKAPTFQHVFIFGALYNTLITHCWWAAVLCGVLAILCPVFNKIDDEVVKVLRSRP